MNAKQLIPVVRRATAALALVCSATTTSLAFAQGASQSLVDVYELARQRDAQFAASRKALEAAREKLPQARAGLLPSVTLSGSDNRQVGEASFSYEPYVQRDVRSWSWNAQLTQPLVRWANWVGWQQADIMVRQAQEQFALAEQDLILRTAQAYLDLLLSAHGLQVAQAQVRAVGEQLLLAQRNFEVGTGAVTDVHEARARQALALAQEVAARNELAGKQAELSRLTGEQVKVPALRVAGTLPPIQESDLEVWLTAAQQNSLQVRIQRSQVEVAEKETAKSLAQHLPMLDLVLSRSANFASGSLNSPADLASRVHTQQVGIQLNVPLFGGGAVQSRVRESLALEEKARDELLAAERIAQVQVRQSFSGVVNGLAQVQALEAAAEAARHAVESNKIGFRIGTRINPDVLNAQQQFYTTLRDLTRARADTMMHGLRLKAAAGSLEPDALQALDRLLEPEQTTETPNAMSSIGGSSFTPMLVPSETSLLR